MEPKPPTVKTEVTVTVQRGDRTEFIEATILGPDEVVQASTTGIKDLGKIVYPRVGRCIYCSATDDLRREHIIPFGLNGTAVLPEASCARCARITATVEAQVLRGPMREVRVLRRLRSRSRHAGVPGTQRLTVVRSGVTEAVQVPIEQYPILLHFPTFSLPRFLTGQDGSGIEVTGVASVLFGPRPEEVARRLGAQSIILESQRDRPIAFARMLAKIGYAMAVAQGAESRLDGPSPVLPSMLGELDDIGRWVGTLTDPIRKYPGTLHRIAIREDHAKGLLLAEVQLFSDSETPSYGVILGNLP